MDGLIIGKRVGVGAAITSTLGVLAHYWPDHAAAFIGLAVPLTLGLQVWIVNKFGVTTGEK